MTDLPAHESIPAADSPTEEYPTLAGELAAPELSLDDPGADDEWPVSGPKKGIRLAVPAAALVGFVLVACGFWGGAELQKHRGGSSSGAANFASIAARFRGSGTSTTTTSTSGTGAAGFTGAGLGGASNATTGTLSVVNGNTLYVLTSAGALVKVTLEPSTTITRNAKTKNDGLRPGDTVVVSGSTGKNGAVAASSVAATAPGVTSTSGFGGFGGGGFGGRTGSTNSGGNSNG
jgi:hypothetical protein